VQVKGEVSGVRLELRRFLELAALTGLALVQPTLDVLGRSPETFVFRRVDGTELVLFAAAVALTPAIVLWLVGLVSSVFGERVRRVVHLISIAVLGGLAALVALKSALDLFGAAALVTAVGIGLLTVLVYQRLPVIRLFLGYLSVLPLLALAAFLVASPASGLVRGQAYDLVEDPGTTTPLVVLVVDELPTAELLDADGDIDAERFPAFASLTEDARWFRNYSSVSNFTIHAVPALLSAEAPEVDDVPLLDDHPRNLFTLLGGAYDLNVSEAITRLCPPEVCPANDETTSSGLPGIAEDTADVLRELVSLKAFPGPESDFFVEPVTDPEDETFRHGRDAEVQPTRFRDFLTALAPSADPSLHYLHLVLPHEPWRFFPDGTEYRAPVRDPRGDPEGVWVSDWAAGFGRLRFELQARYTDALVGQFLDRLRETDLWDDAVVVVVADHGASFLPGEGRRILTDGNAHEIMWSPLFIRAPGLEQGVTDVAAQSFDVLPTVAELLGTEVPWDVEGTSLLGRDDGSAESADGDRSYYRFPNRHFPEDEAVLDIDGDATFATLLGQDPAPFSADDPLGSFYGTSPVGDLYGRDVEDLDVGTPVEVTAEVEDLHVLTDGGAHAVPAYLGGGIVEGTVDDDTWIVAAVDGTVVGVSALFPEERHDRGFALLADPDQIRRSGVVLDLFVTDGPDDALHPIDVVEG
jgi:hypothetical protein